MKQPLSFDCLITGGEVIDGTRAPRVRADVGVRAGRIAAVGDLSTATASRTVDARGRIVAPGFIDTHTHDDQALLDGPTLPFKVSQGVTTVVAGNCGVSAAPWRRGLHRPPPLDLINRRGADEFETFGAYLDALRTQPAAVNVAAMIGHTSLRGLTMSALDRPATATEIDAMASHVADALQAGAIGLSTGTFYPPAAAATTAEIIAVAQPLAGGAGLYATHMRDEADQVMEAIDETLTIGRALDCPVMISHHKVSGSANFGRSQQTLARIGDAMRSQCVCLDCYPYVAGSTMIRTDRAMLAQRVLINTSVPHPECNGRDLADIAAE